jgi:hypothetical protein
MHQRNLYGALISQACNFGSTRASDLMGIPADTLDSYTEWYLREETNLQAANTVVVNEHYRPAQLSAINPHGTHEVNVAAVRTGRLCGKGADHHVVHTVRVEHGDDRLGVERRCLVGHETAAQPWSPARRPPSTKRSTFRRWPAATRSCSSGDRSWSMASSTAS